MSSSKNKIYISTRTPEKTRELYKKHKSIPTKHKYQSNTFYPRPPNNIFSNNSKGFQFGGFKRRSQKSKTEKTTQYFPTRRSVQHFQSFVLPDIIENKKFNKNNKNKMEINTFSNNVGANKKNNINYFNVSNKNNYYDVIETDINNYNNNNNNYNNFNNKILNSQEAFFRPKINENYKIIAKDKEPILINSKDFKNEEKIFNFNNKNDNSSNNTSNNNTFNNDEEENNQRPFKINRHKKKLLTTDLKNNNKLIKSSQFNEKSNLTKKRMSVSNTVGVHQMLQTLRQSVNSVNKIMNNINQKTYNAFNVLRYYEISQEEYLNEKKSKKTNDLFIHLDSLFKLKQFKIFGLFNSIGDNKDYLNYYFKQEVKNYFENKFKDEKISYEKLYNFLSENDYKNIGELYERIHQDLIDSELDTNFTALNNCIVYVIQKKIIVTKIGNDAKCVIIKENENNNNLEIKNIFKYEENVELKNNDLNENNIEEITFGENAKKNNVKIDIKNFGFKTDFYEGDILNNYCFILLGSSELFKYINDKNILNICKKYYYNNNTKSLVDNLMEFSLKEKEDIKLMNDFKNKKNNNDNKNEEKNNNEINISIFIFKGYTNNIRLMINSKNEE